MYLDKLYVYFMSDKLNFILAGGRFGNTNLAEPGLYGNYWCTTYYNTSNALDMYFNSGTVNFDRLDRFWGRSIHAVQ